MSQAITRIYDSAAKAAAAVEQLKRRGFTNDQITTVSPAGANGSLPSSDAIAALLMKGWVLKAHATRYAEDVRRGGHLVSVLAPFARGNLATVALERAGPMASSVKVEREPSLVWDERTPASSALRIPVLSSDPVPLSTFWNLPVLTRRQTAAASLTDPNWSLSAKVGMPMISSGSLSAKLGIPLLLKPNRSR